MGNQERWNIFIKELREYIEEHKLGPSKHTSLYNQCRYFKRKMKDGSLDPDNAKELESVLGMRDLTIHTGGRRKASHEDENEDEDENFLYGFQSISPINFVKNATGNDFSW